MNCAMGHGSGAGRCARMRGKCLIRTFTSSVLFSQNVAKSARSSSGVSKSDEKMVVVASKDTFSSGASGGRLRAFVFVVMAVLPLDLPRFHLEPRSVSSERFPVPSRGETVNCAAIRQRQYGRGR